MPIRKRRKMKHNLSKEEYTKKVTKSPWAGVPFPTGTKRKVFEVYCQFGGNLTKTREYIKKNNILDNDRTPNMFTLQKWATEDHWKVIREVADDGILDVLEMDDDPDIQDIIRDDAGLFKFLARLQSGIYAKMGEKDSPLAPKDSKEAIVVLKHIQETMAPAKERMNEAKSRRGGSEPQVEVDNVSSIAAYLNKNGIAPTKENIARQAVSLREQQASS